MMLKKILSAVILWMVIAQKSPSQKIGRSEGGYSNIWLLPQENPTTGHHQIEEGKLPPHPQSSVGNSAAKEDYLKDRQILKYDASEIQMRELIAQESMANASWLQIYIGSASIFFILLTWRQTRHALIEAKKSSQAAVKSAEAAAKTIDVSRDIADAHARPWISVECRIERGFHFYTTHYGVKVASLNVIVRAKNHGNSPATNVILRAEMSLMTRESGDLMAKFGDKFRQSGQIQVKDGQSLARISRTYESSRRCDAGCSV